MTPASPSSADGAVRTITAPSLADHGQRRRPTLNVLHELHDLIRLEATKDSAGLTKRLKNVLGEIASSELLTKWLRLHLEASQQSTEAISEGLQHWLHQNNPIRYPAGLPVTRRQLLEHCLTFQAGAVDNKLLATLIAGGLGLVLIRYSPVLLESYYHWLLCDLIPDETRCNMMNTLAVPEGHGTIGWVMELSRVMAMTDPALLTNPTPVALSSCFLDPRGRVATEDLIVGNRSWIGLPLFDTEEQEDTEISSKGTDPTRGRGPAPIGVLFCFLPLDGLFCFDDGTRIRESPFVRRFQKAVISKRQELLLALKLEAASRVHHQPPNVVPHVRPGEDTTIDSMARTLLPDQVEPDEPLGFLMLLVAETATDGKCVNLVRMREQTFVNRLFELLQLGSLYPATWAPTSAWILDCLRIEVEHASRTDPNLVWDWHGGKDDDLHQFYPPEIFAHETLRDIACKLDSARRDRASLEEQRLSTEHRLTRKLRKGLELHSPGTKVIDLLMPIIEQDQDRRRCRGLIRIKCRRHSSGDDTEDVDPFRRLYTLFYEHCSPWVDSFARFLGELETQIAATNISLGTWKVYCDLRTVFCDAVAWRLTQVFQSQENRVSDESGRMSLVETATELENHRLAKIMNRCRRDLESFCGNIEAKRQSLALPEIMLVSVWLTSERYAIAQDTASNDDLRIDEILMGDHGLRDLLRTLVDRDPNSPGSGFLSLKEHQPVRQKNQSVPSIRPPAFLGDSTETLSYMARAEPGGLGVSLKLKSNSREWTTQWMRTRFPEPTAVHFVAGAIELNLFADLRKNGAFQVTDKRPAIPSGKVEFAPLTEVLEVNPDLSAEAQKALCRFDEVANILWPSSSEATTWRAVSLTAQGRAGALLAYRPSPETPTLLRECNAAVLRVQSEYSRIYQLAAINAEVELARQEQERMKALRHSLVNVFSRFQGAFEELKDDLPEEGFQRLMGHFRYLRVLIQACVKYERTIKPWTTDVHEMLELLVKWLGAGNERISLECSGEKPLACKLGALSMFMILANLIENAIKYAGVHGTVYLSCHPCPKHADSVTLTIENSGDPMIPGFARYLSGKTNRLPEGDHNGIRVVVHYLRELGLPFPSVKVPVFPKKKTGTRIALTLPMTLKVRR